MGLAASKSKAHDALPAARPAVSVDASADPMQRAHAVLERVFGYKSFRSHQHEIVSTLIGGGDALVLMPTGGGKSLCYQLPALLLSPPSTATAVGASGSGTPRP